MVDSVANVLLETLRDVLTEEVKLLSGVGDEVKEVERDLRTIHGLLMEADRARCDSTALKNCIAQLKELAFRAEIVLETYSVKVASRKQGTSSLKKKLQRLICILSECYNVHQVGKDTQAIRSRLADLTDELKSALGQQGSSQSTNEEDQRHLLRLKYAHEVEQHFVGMKEDIDLLVSMVKDETTIHRVVSICGMGGLGKTTLARKIYNNRDVEHWFDARAWVCVTQQFQAKIVLSNVWKQLDKNQQTDNMGVSELVEGIHNFVVQRKCLIVIDDIWENDDWDIIKPAFPMNCRVVVTTRSENVGYEERHLHKLDYLTEDEGWELLHKIALPADHHALEALEYTGRQIVRKCGRLPLAISVIGGILRQKQPIFAEWNQVSINIDSYLRHGEGVKHNRGVEQVLKLSYDALPYYLKPCFLYMGCFPEDQEIGTGQLYVLWMAEGLISYEQKGRNETLRDVAQRYLSELAMRCMVQVKKAEFYSPGKKFSICRLHDLMHDLCSSKAEEEKFFKRIQVSDVPSSIGTSISRLVISFDGDGDGDDDTTFSLNGIEELEDLRSLLVFFNGRSFKDIIHFGNIFDKSKHLRTLVLENCEFESEKLPSKVGKLIHLRYLNLFCARVKELPKSIFELPYLHTLDLRVFSTIKLPNVIWKLKRLRHLLLLGMEVIGEEKLRLDGLKELETLKDIKSSSACIADIPKLINLRRLGVRIEDMDSLSIFAHHINSQTQLCEVELRLWCLDLSSEEGSNNLRNVLMSPSLVDLYLYKCNISGGFPCYEQGMCQNLVELSFHKSKVGGDVMEELGKYPMLQDLHLNGAEVAMKTETIFRPNSFPELKILYLGKLPNLKTWEVEERALPKLTQLLIENCINLEKIPEGLRFISTLGELHTWDMPEEFKDRVRIVNGKAGEDYHNVCHIPTIEIN